MPPYTFNLCSGFITYDVFSNTMGQQIKETNQFTYDYVKLKIGYVSNRIPVWEGIFTLENLT